MVGAHEHHVQHRIGEGGVVVLGDVGDLTGQSPGGEVPGVPAFEGNGPFIAGQQSQHAAEQGGLARTVGPQEKDQLTHPQVERHPLEDGPVAVGEVQITNVQHQRNPPFRIMR